MWLNFPGRGCIKGRGCINRMSGALLGFCDARGLDAFVIEGTLWKRSCGDMGVDARDWVSFWETRARDACPPNSTLEFLIELDGFYIDLESWLGHAATVARLLRISPGDSLYEVGCGGGAFLLALKSQVNVLVGGMDSSPSMVSHARRALPGSRFVCADATNLDPAEKFDHVLAHSVFQYLTSEDAATVLTLMLDKARSSVLILDVPDAGQRSEIGSAAGHMDHTYFSKMWFARQAAVHGASTEFFPGLMRNFAPGKRRFGVLIRRSEGFDPS
jgi:SAM-dependent methyltransferase